MLCILFCSDLLFLSKGYGFGSLSLVWHVLFGEFCWVALVYYRCGYCVLVAAGLAAGSMEDSGDALFCLRMIKMKKNMDVGARMAEECGFPFLYCLWPFLFSASVNFSRM